MATVAKAFSEDQARLIASLRPAAKATLGGNLRTSSAPAKMGGKSVARKPPKRAPSRTAK